MDLKIEVGLGRSPLEKGVRDLLANAFCFLAEMD
jgi:hypothetical protein